MHIPHARDVTDIIIGHLFSGHVRDDPIRGSLHDQFSCFCGANVNIEISDQDEIVVMQR